MIGVDEFLTTAAAGILRLPSRKSILWSLTKALAIRQQLSLVHVEAPGTAQRISPRDQRNRDKCRKSYGRELHVADCWFLVQVE